MVIGGSSIGSSSSCSGEGNVGLGAAWWRHAQEGMSCLAVDAPLPLFSPSFSGEHGNQVQQAWLRYADTGTAWVGLGAPVVASESGAPAGTHDGHAVQAFDRAARGHGRRACLFGVERRLVDKLGDRWTAIGIGDEPLWTPAGWLAMVRVSASMREQLRRARAKGVRVVALGVSGVWSRAQTRASAAELTRLRTAWLASRGLPPLGFALAPADLPALLRAEHRGDAQAQRVWGAYCQRTDRLVGALVATPVPASGGWIVRELFYDRTTTPNGTSQLLLHTAMQAFANTGAGWVSLGLCPATGSAAAWMRGLGQLSRGCYNFTGVRDFRARLRPERWRPLYAAVPVGRFAAVSRLLAMKDVLAAFAQGALMPFAGRAVVRAVKQRGRGSYPYPITSQARRTRASWKGPDAEPKPLGCSLL